MMKSATDGPRAKGRGERVKLAFILTAYVFLGALVILWGVTLGRTEEVQAGGLSEGSAMGVGLALIAFGLTAAAVRASARFLDDAEDAHDLRREGRALLLGAGALVAAGSSLILLSLAGPERLVPPACGLAGALLLNVLATVLVAARWRRLDELNRAVTRDAGSLAFGWFSAVGGTWATVAHLGFVVAPSPLDWVTMFSGFSFVAGLVAMARKGGFDAPAGRSSPNN
jgi:hypothetical protein